jgi:hypothetical protein
MMHIDIPSDKILPKLLESIQEQMKEVVLPGNKKMDIDTVEWTEKGLRVWIVTEK